jgi:hypothetical protein
MNERVRGESNRELFGDGAIQTAIVSKRERESKEYRARERKRERTQEIVWC